MNTKIWGLVLVFFTTSLYAMKEKDGGNERVSPFDFKFSALEPPPSGQEKSKFRKMLSARTRSKRSLTKGSAIRRKSESSKDFQVVLAAVMQRLTNLEQRFDRLEKAQKRTKKKQRNGQFEQLTQQIQSLERIICQYYLEENKQPYMLLEDSDEEASIGELSEEEQLIVKKESKKKKQKKKG